MSESGHFRQRRHNRLLSLLDTLTRPLSILDVGGSPRYWQRYGAPSYAHITLLNLRPEPVPRGYTLLVGDACAMPQFADGQFDFVFSNSVIEHVGAWPRQQAMAHEIQRVGRAFWVQTPAREFPLEPHYHLPLFQFWPLAWRLVYVQHRHARKGGDPARLDEALHECRLIRLLSAAEMRLLFPEAHLWRERMLLLTKSFVALSRPSCPPPGPPTDPPIAASAPPGPPPAAADPPE